MKCSLLTMFCVFICCAIYSSAQQAAPAAGGTEDLAKASQNPVASLISVPIQNNSNFGIGPYDRTQNVLNIQPVIPMKATENVNLIVRWIAPIIYQPAPEQQTLKFMASTKTHRHISRLRRFRPTPVYLALAI